MLAGITVAVLGLGSNLMYASSRAWVYHEAALWGTAGALASFAAVLAFLELPRTKPIVVAGIWAAIAWLSRGSVGLGPTVVLGLLGLAHLTGFRFLQTLAPRPVDPETSDGRGRWSRQPKRAAWLLAASLTGAAAFGVINTAKFGSPNGLPIDKQVSSIEAPWPERKAAFAAYGGNLFSAELVPANVVQGLRPDLLAPTSVWPLVRYRYAEPIGLFTPVFDTVEPSAGLTLTVPALLVLGTVGAVAAFRPRRWTGRDRRPPGNETSLRPFRSAPPARPPSPSPSRSSRSATCSTPCPCSWWPPAGVSPSSTAGRPLPTIALCTGTGSWPPWLPSRSWPSGHLREPVGHLAVPTHHHPQGHRRPGGRAAHAGARPRTVRARRAAGRPGRVAAGDRAPGATP